MRIAQVCPPIERVPPPAYGGIEAVVSSLTEELVRRGHDVTLYATGNSHTRARLRWACPRPLRATCPDNPLPNYLQHLALVLEDGHQYDVIHNHCGEFLMVFARLLAVPMLTTVHGPLVADNGPIWDSYPGFFNTISQAAKDGFPDRGYLGVVYNGIDVATFPFTPEKDDFLLFLGRISPEKGTHRAIEAARAVGRRLIIAGKIDRVDRAYWEAEVEPWIDGEQIQYFGEANGQQKRALYARACCLLDPIDWSEPFGLVMAEAMACGTPVIAMRRGSAPEVVADGETGFVVDTLEEMIAAIGHVGEIDPYRCRARVEERFSAERMADGYERRYREIRGAAEASESQASGSVRPKMKAARAPAMQ